MTTPITTPTSASAGGELDALHTADVLRLPTEVMAQHAVGYFSHREKPWRRFDFAWSDARAEQLTEDQRAAVSFITLIEDHLPGYVAEYLRVFPVTPGQPPAEYAHNREFYHFATRWADEEDAHAHALTTYQIRTGLRSADDLRRDLAIEGTKRFTVNAEQPIEILTYALIQEKATQLFYQRLAHGVEEPVLRDLLRTLARDEARHFAFFAGLVEAYVAAFHDRALERMKHVLVTFKMPLADTLKNYWRWALRVADAAPGYSHTEAYEALAGLINRATDARTSRAGSEIVELITNIRRVA